MEKKLLIRTEKLCRTFVQGEHQEHILQNIDLEIYQGDFTVIMGASGSGKSTLLYLLSSMDRPSLGRVIFEGRDITACSEDEAAVFRREHCGFIFQQIHLIDSMSVMDNLIVCGLLGGQSRGQARARAKELLEMMDVHEKNRDKFPHQLSGGEAQRVGAARAAMNFPSLLFVDEPTGALNAKGEEVLDLLGEMHRKGQSVVLVTHDIRAAERGSRILYLKDGKIQGEYKAGEFEAPDSVRRAGIEAFLREMGW